MRTLSVNELGAVAGGLSSGSCADGKSWGATGREIGSDAGTVLGGLAGSRIAGDRGLVAGSVGGGIGGRYLGEQMGEGAAQAYNDTLNGVDFIESFYDAVTGGAGGGYIMAHYHMPCAE